MVFSLKIFHIKMTTHLICRFSCEASLNNHTGLDGLDSIQVDIAYLKK